MTRAEQRMRRWGYAWVHSDLIGIPFTLAVFAIM
jgi:hypothetical protein